MTVAAGFAVVGVVLTVLLTNSLQNNDSYSSITGVLLSLATTFTTVMLVLRRPQPPPRVDTAAADLADELLVEWDREIRHRRERFGGSRPIPLTWAEVPGLAADPAEVFGSATPVGDVRLNLTGRLEDNPDEATMHLAEAFEQIPSKRLVVIGEPGAGKTFMGIMVTIGLLRRWQPGRPVPVFLSLSSWDPVTESLDDWLVRELATTHFNGDERTPRALLVRPRLLPVLDGLDELPEHLRRSAIRRINKVLDGDRPLVVTCRSAEYASEIDGGAPRLRRAPVVEIKPISVPDILAQLTQDRSWATAAKVVERAPSTPFAAALGTPLMLSLFMSAYADRDPGELLDQTRFTSRHDVEDHLIDTMIGTAYSDDVLAAVGPKRRWSGDDARRWLSYLAVHLHEHGDRNLNWWQLAPRTLSPWVAVAVGVPVGLVVLLVTEICYETIFPKNPGVGMAAAILNSPAAVSHESRRARQAALTGASLIFLPGFLVWLAAAETDTENKIVTSATQFGMLLALSAVSGAALAWVELLARRPQRSGPLPPPELLRRERRSALLAAAAAALLVSTTAVLAMTVSAALAGHIGQRVALFLGKPAVVDLHLPPIEDHVPWLLGWYGLPVLTVLSILLGALYAIGILVIRPWPRFVVARTRLSVRGELPWHLMDFLADARTRGLLRVAGSSYQFWHVRLQDRLVADPHLSSPEERPRRSRLSAAVVGITAAATVVAIGSVEPAGCRPVGIGHVDDRMQRTVIGDLSGCFAELTGRDWEGLTMSSADRDTLTGLATTKGDSFHTARIVVLGKLDRVTALEWHEVLAGLTKAAKTAGSAFELTLVQKDTGDLRAADANELTAEYLQSTSLGWHPQYTALDLDNDAVDNRAVDDFHMIFATSKLGYRDLSDSLREQLAQRWLGSVADNRGAPTITDGISDSECFEIRRSRSDYRTFAFDLRAVEVTAELVNRLRQCGGGTALVAADQVPQLRPLVREPTAVGLNWLKDDSRSIFTDCQSSPDPASLEQQICVAALAGASGFRMTITPIEKN
ncbi:NACHT domain-containing protein [Amycolatopsis vastitatis]|uniref:NACHT domain-containing protein n=1 Tax=Amycolatopsis vastitatis TaxID=1905142 RepID=UPI001304367C|nr:NACHT domain-containing protein [Amycolatopsis vastitatis]